MSNTNGKLTKFEGEHERWDLPRWYVPAFGVLVVAVFGLIALGGSVRIMKAGLACPDWPLCFGDVIPDYHPQVYFEFIHRALAGGVALVTVGLLLSLWRSRAPRMWKALGVLAVLILMGQIVFGGLTVVLLLKSGVVLTHLLLGTSFFSTLLWIYLLMKWDSKPVDASSVGPKWLLPWSIFLLMAVFSQLALGGLVAANFASLVCIDFPTCHGQWFPTFSGIIGLHIIHRLGAYTVFLLVSINAFLVARFGLSTRLRQLAKIMWVCVCVQVGLGIANVLLLTPPLIAVCHLAMGVGLLSVAHRQVHAVLPLVQTLFSAKPGRWARRQSPPQVLTPHLG